ncbi:hypothetical protein [Haloarcula sediminis]|uniref:hypothetical protein n=1 Tax=Haloarcula sediminis TaxID=3111777 RepID=UPI002D77AAD1|nr:hypothetical protein [Haloarcula sp. CK38]
MTATADEDLRAGLETAVADRLSEGADWSVTGDAGDCVTVSLPDRRLLARRRDGPDGADHWTLELAADGATVSKFGPFETVGEVTEQVRTLLDSDVRYTVCCDG